jgi:hypothetical protein
LFSRRQQARLTGRENTSMPTRRHSPNDRARRFPSHVPSRAPASVIEPIEPRRLLSGGPEPVTLLDELVLPGDVQVGAAPNAQYDPYIAAGPDGTSLAVWTDYRTGGHPNLLWGPTNGTLADVWAARIAADGTLIDQLPISINHDQWHQKSAKAAWNGTNWLIAWTSDQEPNQPFIHAARLSADGEMLDASPILIMDDRYVDQYGNNRTPDALLDVQPNGDGGWVVTWSRQESPNVAFYGTRVQADGTVHPADVNGRLLQAPQLFLHWVGLTYSPSNGGQFLQVVFYNNQLRTMRRASDLSSIDGVYTASVNSGFSPYQNDLVGSPAGWMLAYRGASGAEAFRVGPNNEHLDVTPRHVAPLGGDPKVAGAFDGNGYVVTYTLGNNDQIWARRLSTAGVVSAPLLVETLGNPAYTLRADGLGDGRYGVLLADSTGGQTDIAVVNVNADDSTTDLADVSNAGRAHTAPQIASDGTNSLAVFRSFNADEGAIKGVRLTPTGQPLDAEPFTIVPNALGPGAPNIVFFDGRYVVVFKGTGPAGNILYGQQVSTDGQLIGAPVALTGGMGNGEVGLLGNRMLISGLSNEGSLERSVRFARVFDENLVPLTDRINISYGFAGGGDITTVGGRWLLAFQWKSSHNAPRSGIAYAFVAPDGTTTGAQELVTSYPDNGAVTVVSAGPNAPALSCRCILLCI